MPLQQPWQYKALPWIVDVVGCGRSGAVTILWEAAHIAYFVEFHTRVYLLLISLKQVHLVCGYQCLLPAAVCFCLSRLSSAAAAVAGDKLFVILCSVFATLFLKYQGHGYKFKFVFGSPKQSQSWKPHNKVSRFHTSSHFASSFLDTLSLPNSLYSSPRRHFLVRIPRKSFFPTPLVKEPRTTQVKLKDTFFAIMQIVTDRKFLQQEDTMLDTLLLFVL